MAASAIRLQGAQKLIVDGSAHEAQRRAYIHIGGGLLTAYANARPTVATDPTYALVAADAFLAFW